MRTRTKAAAMFVGSALVGGLVGVALTDPLGAGAQGVTTSPRFEIATFEVNGNGGSFGGAYVLNTLTGETWYTIGKTGWSQLSRLP